MEYPLAVPTTRRGLLLASAATLAACVGRSGARKDARFVSASLSADEILWALGADARAQVIGVSALVDDPRYSGIPGRWSTSLPRVGGTSEELLALDPSLVFLSAYTVPETAAILRSSGVEVAMLGACDGLADLRLQILQVASACRLAARGDAIVRALNSQCARIAERGAAYLQRGEISPRVLCVIGDLVPGLGTTFDDVCSLAGIRNVASEQDVQGWGALKDELLLAWTPDWIIVPCLSDCDADAQALGLRAGASTLRAVLDGRVIALSQSMVSSSSAAMLDFAAILQARIFGLDALPPFRLEDAP